MTTLYVKKLWSENPTKHTYITLDKAHEQYACYVARVKILPLKSFNRWLRTEI
jgi:hypothetical protein